ncbi:leucine-rich repeat domain-containing protein [Simkania negevensis]|uniref:Uncharacterized protein n=1 Tax=Simkania negevensis (strain ATCC VR-1471 / DSM 27360 / Z) TaxID=331113 RepID=F8L570_SIMNZ|nr:hypothetical protein [Simkania negevensis]CCB87951.1 unknown protein [Simkania negevensis Z]
MKKIKKRHKMYTLRESIIENFSRKSSLDEVKNFLNYGVYNQVYGVFMSVSATYGKVESTTHGTSSFPSDDKTVLTDQILVDYIKTQSIENLQALEKCWTESSQSIDFSNISPEVALQWLSSLSKATFKIDRLSFPFISHIDIPTETLEALIGEKTEVEFSWVNLTDQTFSALVKLMERGRITKIKIQGGFELDESKFKLLIKTLQSHPKLTSLELSNLRITKDQMIAISNVLPGIKTLTYLTLETNGITEEIVEPFEKMLETSPHLKVIKLTFSKFESIPGIAKLFNWVKEPQILDLSSNWDYC